MEDNEILNSQMNWLPSSSDAKSQMKKKWPGPVTFDEERHYVRLSLSIPELKKKLFKKYDNVQVDFDQGSVKVEVTVPGTKDDESSTVVYVYEKSLPEDILKDKSRYSVEEGRLVLKMVKSSHSSWAQHCQHFIERPEGVSL